MGKKTSYLHNPNRWPEREKMLKGIANNPRPAADIRHTFAVVCGGHRERAGDVLLWLRDAGLVKAPPSRNVGVYSVTESGAAAVLALNAGQRLEAWLDAHRKAQAAAKEGTAPAAITPRQELVISTLLAEARREGAAA